MTAHLAADLGERLGFGAGAIPDRDVMAGLDEPFRHGKAHAAHADPADFLGVFRGHAKLLCCRTLSYHRARTLQRLSELDTWGPESGLHQHEQPASMRSRPPSDQC